jgi:hypothetical protein
MFEDIRQLESLHPHFTQLAHFTSGAAHLTQLMPADACTVIDGSVHYEHCPFKITTECPANLYHITPSMECGVVGAIVPNLNGEEAVPQLMAGNPSHPLTATDTIYQMSLVRP